MRTGQRRAAPTHSFDPDVPAPGCYRVKLRKDAPDSAVRIWLGHPQDPDTGEEMLERPFMWQCELNGQRVPLERFWPACAVAQISREEHDRLCARNRTMDPASPFYDPRRPIDLGTAPPPF